MLLKTNIEQIPVFCEPRMSMKIQGLFHQTQVVYEKKMTYLKLWVAKREAGVRPRRRFSPRALHPSGGGWPGFLATFGRRRKGRPSAPPFQFPGEKAGPSRSNSASAPLLVGGTDTNPHGGSRHNLPSRHNFSRARNKVIGYCLRRRPLRRAGIFQHSWEEFSSCHDFFRQFWLSFSAWGRCSHRPHPHPN
jgi:hypothetical protein